MGFAKWLDTTFPPSDRTLSFYYGIYLFIYLIFLNLVCWLFAGSCMAKSWSLDRIAFDHGSSRSVRILA